MNSVTHLTSPYKGLVPYSEEDADFFFGREAEQEIITANLMASRLTVLYGASGVGKSSVLRAGVAHGLHQLAERNLTERGSPEFAVVIFDDWRDDPLIGLADQVQDAVPAAAPLETRDQAYSSSSLVQTLKDSAERAGGELFVILDQFEEYFLYHPQEDGEGTFAIEFPRAVNAPDLHVGFLIAVREDSLAKLDRFKGRIPNLFDNYLRLEHLDYEAAEAAIWKPLGRYNRLTADREEPVKIESTLIDAVLMQVRTGQVILGERGRGSVGGVSPSGVRIESPYLQLVMTRLWDEEMQSGSRVLRLQTLERLGSAEEIVKTHLDGAMQSLSSSEREAAASIFHHLVTPSGTKIAHTVTDLAEYTEHSREEVATVLDQLASPEVRILRSVAPPPGQSSAQRYEIFHDVLALAILDWRTRYIQAQTEARNMERTSSQLWSIIKTAMIGVIFGLLGSVLGIVFISFPLPLGLVAVAVALRLRKPRFSFKQILAVAIGWVIGWIASLAISLVLGLILSIVGAGINGTTLILLSVGLLLFSGPAGGAVALWRINQVERTTQLSGSPAKP